MTDWSWIGPVITAVAVLLVSICGGVGLLFKIMGMTYGTIIDQLRKQNEGQQGQIDYQQKRLDALNTDHKDCTEKHADAVREIAVLKEKMSQQEKRPDAR